MCRATSTQNIQSVSVARRLGRTMMVVLGPTIRPTQVGHRIDVAMLGVLVGFCGRHVLDWTLVGLQCACTVEADIAVVPGFVVAFAVVHCGVLLGMGCSTSRAIARSMPEQKQLSQRWLWP
jgi:hypothetical protein